MLEVYTYKIKQVKVLLTDESVSNLEKSTKTDEEKAIRTEEYRRRAKKNFRRLIEANCEQHQEKDKFLTLTYEKNMQDREQSLKNFRNFIKKARRKYGKFEYLAVMEYQERGAIHFHCFLFGFPFIPRDELQKLANTWKHGSIDLKAVKDYFKLQNYLTKYFMKTFDDEKANNERRFFASKGLKRSEEIILENQVDFEKLGHELVNHNFHSNFVGDVDYKKVRLYIPNKNLELDEIVSKGGVSTEPLRF